MHLELRQVRYFLAVAEEGSITRAAERLHIAQPSLSAAIQQLERRLGVDLLERRGRRVALTPAGALLAARGRDLLEQAAALVAEVQGRDAAAEGRLRLGVTPTARFGVAPRVLAACARRVPALMLYTSEDTTGALLRDVADGRLDLAITFCAPDPPPDGVRLVRLRDEPAIVHVPADHRFAARGRAALAELAGEDILVASSPDSSGFSARVLAHFADAGIHPRTRVDPYPDLGLRAVREGLGVVVYVRSAFPPDLDGSAFVALEPPLSLPFDLAVRAGSTSAAVAAVLDIAADDAA